MTRGARQAANGMGITDADIRRCVESPDDTAPDARNATRTRYRRGALTVLAAADGTVLRVEHRGR